MARSSRKQKDYDILLTNKESKMSKFKVGDKVLRVSESYGKAIKGGVYEISEVSNSSFVSSYGINLKGHEVEGMGKFNYEASCFEMYVDECLTPLEAAEALLNKYKLQVFDTDINKWYGFHSDPRNITLEDLKHIKLRHKPKTIMINGVEVPSPAKKDDIEHYFYTVNFSENIVHTVDKLYINNNFKYYWTTEEDAQEVLEAMLIPFNNLDKG